jgi:RimJ/RimL family protein N-acetyltransferase
MQPYVLEGAALRLDQAGPDDVATIAEHCQDPVFERFLTVPWPYSLGDARYFVDEHIPRGWAAGDEFTWAIRTAAGSPLLGVIGFRTARSDLGFWLGAPHRGQGIMPRAVRLVTDHILGAGLPGITTVRWECLVGNAASLAVARKCGFTFTGTKPAHVAARDGSHPESWHAELRLGDNLEEKPGWPVADNSSSTAHHAGDVRS